MEYKRDWSTRGWSTRGIGVPEGLVAPATSVLIAWLAASAAGRTSSAAGRTSRPSSFSQSVIILANKSIDNVSEGIRFRSGTCTGATVSSSKHGEVTLGFAEGYNTEYQGYSTEYQVVAMNPRRSAQQPVAKVLEVNMHERQQPKINKQ